MDEQIAQLLADYPIISHVPVQWADMDRNQHVNNVIYLKYVEVSRLDYFQAIGFFDFTGEKPGPILADTECKYIFPATYPDEIYMGSRISKMSDTDFILQTLLISKKHKKVVAKNESRVVVFDYGQQKKVSMGEEMKQRIAALEA
ncbi:MAG: thioesterase family protein, partial [Bacteroidota bacterium]